MSNYALNAYRWKTFLAGMANVAVVLALMTFLGQPELTQFKAAIYGATLVVGGILFIRGTPFKHLFFFGAGNQLMLSVLVGALFGSVAFAPAVQIGWAMFWVVVLLVVRNKTTLRVPTSKYYVVNREHAEGLLKGWIRQQGFDGTIKFSEMTEAEKDVQRGTCYDFKLETGAEPWILNVKIVDGEIVDLGNFAWVAKTLN